MCVRLSSQGEAKERFNAIQQQLSKLSLKFSNNLQDATKAFKRLATDKAEVEGLPPSALGLAAQTARSVVSHPVGFLASISAQRV